MGAYSLPGFPPVMTNPTSLSNNHSPMCSKSVAAEESAPATTGANYF